MVFALKFNKLTVKPQTGFGKKAYPERNGAAAILYIFLKGLKMKNGQTCIQKAICLEVRKIRAKIITIYWSRNLTIIMRHTYQMLKVHPMSNAQPKTKTPLCCIIYLSFGISD